MTHILIPVPTKSKLRKLQLTAQHQLWLTINTQHSKRIHNSAVYLCCLSNSHAKLSYGSVVSKRPAVGLPVLYIFQFTGKGTEANKSEGGCKLFMKNLPNSTKTQGNFKTANFYFELRAVLKLSHSLFFFLTTVHILSSTTYK